MPKDTEYKKTKNIAEKLKFTYKGVDISMCLLFNIAIVIYKLPITWRDIVVSFVSVYDLKKINLCFKESDIVFSLFSHRKDYIDLVEYSSFGINARKVILDRVKLKLNILALWFVISYLYKYYKILKEFNIKETCYLMSALYRYIDAINKMEKLQEIEWSHKKYIPFNSSFLLENCITQYIRNKGGKTYHLCHGLHFHPYKKFYPLDYLNQFNIAAEVVLAWGNSFVENNKMISKNRSFTMKVVGNPKYQIRQITPNNTFKKCAVFLARDIYNIGNLFLIELIANYKKKYANVEIHVKLHPSYSNKFDEIKDLCKKNNLEYVNDNRTVNDILNDNTFDFAISYQTTTYFEAMYYNLISFRYAYEENENFGEMDDRFTTLSDLEYLVCKFSKYSLEQLKTEIETILINNLGMGINRYKEVITTDF